MTNLTRGFSPDKLIVPEEDPMRRKRFTEEQIVSILKESAAGMKTEEVCRRHGICTNTFCRWKSKYADMEISDVRKLKALESENARLKKIVAEQALDIQALKVVVSKKF
jgi:putative transposase